MKEPITKTFTIPATYDDFKSWLTSYGMAKEKNFIPFGMMGKQGEFIWYYNLQKGNIIFELKVEQPELLSVTAKLVTTYLAGDDGIERWMLDDDPGPMENFKELVEAIRAKYPQARLAKKAKIPRRASRTNLVYAGLIKWYANASDMSIDKAAEKLDLPKSRYYNNPESAYTEDEIAELGTSFEEILEKHRKGADVLDPFLQEKFLQKKQVKSK